jgi:hypothetical protein
MGFHSAEAIDFSRPTTGLFLEIDDAPFGIIFNHATQAGNPVIINHRVIGSLFGNQYVCCVGSRFL